MKGRNRVVVIGSGVGGAAVAALLAREGCAVTVLERNAFPGGKTASYDRDGFVCDMGVHYTTRGERGPIGEVARRVSADLRFIKRNPFIRIMNGNRSCDLPLDFAHLGSLFKLARLNGVKMRNYAGALRAFSAFTSAEKERDVHRYDAVKLQDLVYSYTDDDGFHRLIDVLCGLLLVIPASEASAGEFIWGLSQWVRARSFAYPAGGFRQISKSFLEMCERCGGEIRYKEGAVRIRVGGNRVLGVETEKAFHRADVVVSNAGIKKTIELAGERSFDPSYVRWAMSLKDSAGGITVKYALDYAPTDMAAFLCYGQGGFSKNLELMASGIVPDDPLLFITCPTLADPELAPQGKHSLLVATITPASLTHVPLAEKVLDRVEERIRTLFPDLYDHIIWRHRTNLNYVNGLGGRGAGEVIGLAQRFDQVGKSKPDASMPVAGLYLVGCDAGGRGVGTEEAADSALKVATAITAREATREPVTEPYGASHYAS